MLFWLGVVQKKNTHLPKKKSKFNGTFSWHLPIQNLVESHYYNHYEKWALVINYHSLIMLSKLPWNQPTMKPEKNAATVKFGHIFYVTADSKREEPGTRPKTIYPWQARFYFYALAWENLVVAPLHCKIQSKKKNLLHT